jgi:hypothetical protein
VPCPVDNLLVDGTVILEAPGLGRAEVPGSRVPTGGIDDLAILAVGRANDLAIVSAGVDAARDLSDMGSRLDGEVGTIDIFPGMVLAEGLGKPPAAGTAGRASRLVWAVPSLPKVLGAVVTEGRVRPGRASVVPVVRLEVGGNDDLLGKGGGPIEVGRKLAGRAGGAMLPGVARDIGARVVGGKMEEAVRADPARGMAARDGGGIIDLADAAGASLEVGATVLEEISGRGFARPV